MCFATAQHLTRFSFSVNSLSNLFHHFFFPSASTSDQVRSIDLGIMRQGFYHCADECPSLSCLKDKTSGLYYKSFIIAIYNCNDSSQYYNTMITIVSNAPNLTLTLASVINYDHKRRCKLKRNLQ